MITIPPRSIPFPAQAQITPPDYAGVGDLPQTNLAWNEADSRYELLYANFTQSGTYVCTFYAQNNAGEVSGAKQADVIVTYAYAGNTAELVTIFRVGDIEQHDFQSTADEDWVNFYAPGGLVFNIEATQLGDNSDLRLDLYYEQHDGDLIFVGAADRFGSGVGFGESLTLDLKTRTSGQLPGVYYVRVSSADTNLFGPGSEYELEIYVPIGGSGGVPFPGLPNPGGILPVGSFYVFLGPSQALAAGAGWRIQQVTNQNYFSDNSVIYSLPASLNYTLSFRDIPDFRAPTNRSLVITADQTTSVMAYYLYTNLSPRAESPGFRTDGAFALTFVAHAGRRYAIEESRNLINWVPVVTNQVPQNGLLHFTKPNLSDNGGAFYRARMVP